MRKHAVDESVILTNSGTGTTDRRLFTGYVVTDTAQADLISGDRANVQELQRHCRVSSMWLTIGKSISRSYRKEGCE